MDPRKKDEKVDCVATLHDPVFFFFFFGFFFFGSLEPGSATPVQFERYRRVGLFLSVNSHDNV